MKMTMTKISKRRRILLVLAPILCLIVIVPSIFSASLPRSSAQSTSFYTVGYGDTLWSIANSHGVSLSALEQTNFLSSPFLIFPNENLTIPNQLDRIATGNPTYDQYDQIILAVSANDGLNPWLLKGQVALETGLSFSQTSTSNDDPCGTWWINGVDEGHSYGPAQETPACLYWFAHYDGIPDLDLNPNAPSWTTSAFNPIYAIWAQGKIWRGILTSLQYAFPGCSPWEYQEMILVAYNTGSGVWGCMSYSSSGGAYLSGVENYYMQFSFNSQLQELGLGN